MELSAAELMSRGSPGKKCSDWSGASCASRKMVWICFSSRFQIVMTPAPPPAANRGIPTPTETPMLVYMTWGVPLKRMKESWAVMKLGFDDVLLTRDPSEVAETAGGSWKRRR